MDTNTEPRHYQPGELIHQGSQLVVVVEQHWPSGSIDYRHIDPETDPPTEQYFDADADDWHFRFVPDAFRLSTEGHGNMGAWLPGRGRDGRGKYDGELPPGVWWAQDTGVFNIRYRASDGDVSWRLYRVWTTETGEWEVAMVEGAHFTRV